MFHQAALGIAGLCVMAMKKEGVSDAEAKSKIWMVDSKGLIVKNRPSGGITEHKIHFARDDPPIDTLTEVVKKARPTVLIGAAAIGGAFTKEILQSMGEFNDRPIIFALSNPTSKAECTAEEAYTATNVRYLYICARREKSRDWSVQHFSRFKQIFLFEYFHGSFR